MIETVIHIKALDGQEVCCHLRDIQLIKSRPHDTEGQFLIDLYRPSDELGADGDEYMRLLVDDTEVQRVMNAWMALHNERAVMARGKRMKVARDQRGFSWEHCDTEGRPAITMFDLRLIRLIHFTKLETRWKATIDTEDGASKVYTCTEDSRDALANAWKQWLDPQ